MLELLHIRRSPAFFWVEIDESAKFVKISSLNAASLNVPCLWKLLIIRKTGEWQKRDNKYSLFTPLFILRLVRRWAFICFQHCRKWLLCQSPRYISTIDAAEPILTTVCRKRSFSAILELGSDQALRLNLPQFFFALLNLAVTNGRYRVQSNQILTCG